MNTAERRPFFSIITPVYNSEAFLRETIDSVRAQTFGDYEHILIDDGSTDGSAALCRAYAEGDPRVRFIQSKQNQGVSGVRNLGMEMANGEYVSFLDSDDVWESDKLFSQYKQVEETGAKFIYASYKHIKEDGTLVKEYICPPQADYKRLLKGSVMGCLTIAIKRDLLKGRKFKNIFHEDYLFWLEILRDHNLKAEGLQKPLARYRLRPSSRSANKKEAALAQWSIYRNHLGLSFLRALPLFMHYAWAGVRKHKTAK